MVKNLYQFELLVLKNATKIIQVSLVYKTLLKWIHFNPICTKIIWGIFIQSFDAFCGHSNIACHMGGPKSIVLWYRKLKENHWE